MVSLIVPVAGDQEAARHLLARIEPDPRVEVILADGGGNPGLTAVARTRPDVRVVRAPRGRARQMNAGAAAAAGVWLIFVHADSELPRGWLDAFLRTTGPSSSDAVRERPVCGGWFQFALDDRAWQARAVEAGVRWRVRLFRLPYGDQGVFVQRHTFEALGGYKEIPLMEDVEFVRRLVSTCRVAEVPVPITTSARRWRADGWAHRSLRNMVLVILYFAGVSPSRLARWYGRTPTASGRPQSS